MVSFAKARTRSLLSRLWPDKDHSTKTETVKLEESKKLIENIAEQNKCFLDASMNGGMWFS